jgi:hypothetical protein
MSSAWILLVGCGVVLALPLVARIARRELDPFEPIVLFALAYGVMFVLRPAVMLAEDTTRFWGVEFGETLPRALLLAFLGAVAFVCAYELTPGSSRGAGAPTADRLDRSAATVAALAVGLVGLAAFVVLLPTSDPVEALRLVLGGRSEELRDIVLDSSTYLWYGSWMLAPAALVLTGLALEARNRLSLWVCAAVALALTLLRTVPLGSRLVLLPLVGGLFVLAYVMRGKRPSTAVIALVAVLALSTSYAMLIVREPESRSDVAGEVNRLLRKPHALLYPLTRGEDAEMAAALSAALTVVPDELGYRFGGATLGDLVTRPVPRELWAGKPLPAREQVVERVWPQFYPGLNPAFSPLLSFYWDLGLVGVVLGMAVFGLGARLLYAWFVARERALAAQLLFASSLWFVVIGIRNDPVDTAVFALFLVAPVMVIVAVSGRSGRRAARLGSVQRGRPLGRPTTAAQDPASR